MPSEDDRSIAAKIALERVLFIGQDRAESMRPPRRCAIVSITDPGRAPARLRNGWDAVLRVQFHDYDPVTFPDEDPDLRQITAGQVAQIVDFCRAHALRCRRVVVHCRYGVSRSAAVAKALCEVTGVAFPDDYSDHNRYVYQLLRAAMRASFSASSRGAGE